MSNSSPARKLSLRELPPLSFSQIGFDGGPFSQFAQFCLGTGENSDQATGVKCLTIGHGCENNDSCVKMMTWPQV